MQRWTTETGKPSVALEILLFNFGVCVFYLGGFCSHSFYYLDPEDVSISKRMNQLSHMLIPGEHKMYFTFSF